VCRALLGKDEPHSLRLGLVATQPGPPFGSVSDQQLWKIHGVTVSPLCARWHCPGDRSHWPGIIWLVRPVSDDGVSAAVEVPEDIEERVRTLCLALPEVTGCVDYSLTRTRSRAQSFEHPPKVVLLAPAMQSSTGKALPLPVACRP
jgi:hypothetical protein